jgi:hypothetical protein
MKSIKWLAPIHYTDFGVCVPGQIVTQDQVSAEVMEIWVAQGLAEFIKDEKAEPVKEISKKHKVKKEA